MSNSNDIFTFVLLGLAAIALAFINPWGVVGWFVGAVGSMLYKKWRNKS